MYRVSSEAESAALVTSADPIGRFLRARKLFDNPVKFALGFEAAILAIYVPSALAVSLVQHPETPLWKDYAAPIFHVAWVALAWAYARQPTLIAQVILEAQKAAGSKEDADVWLRRIGSPVWTCLVVLGIGLGLASYHALAQPSFFDGYYWRSTPFYVLVFLPLVSILVYMGLMTAARQSLTGLGVIATVWHFRPSSRLGPREARRTSLRHLRAGGTLTVQTAPWVILGIWLACWIAIAVLRGEEENPLLYLIAGLYPPGLFFSLLLPLGFLSLDLRRLKASQLRGLQRRLQVEFEKAAKGLGNGVSSEETIRNIRDLKEVIVLADRLYPVVPVPGLSLQIIAAGAAFQIVTSLSGLGINLAVRLGVGQG